MGGRPPDVSDSEILRVLSDASDPVLSTIEVSGPLPIGEQGTYQRLKELEIGGFVASKSIGRGLAWWITEEGEKYLNGEIDESELEEDNG